MTVIRFIILTLFSAFTLTSTARTGLKTNLVSDALLNVNAGVEVMVDSKWSIDVTADYNNWTLSHGRRWRHWIIQPEARWWTKEAFSGLFFAGHLFAGQFNVMFNQRGRYQGPVAGLGVGAGYAWRFHRHWSLEAECALGFARYHYNKYVCGDCGQKVSSRSHNFLGITKVAISVVYIIN